MNQDKWIEQLHDKLADYEVAPPEGLWEEIAPLCPPRRGKSRFVTLRRWTAAAAVAALMIGGGYLWWNGNDPQAEVAMTQGNSPLVQDEEPETTQEVTQEMVSPPVQEKLAMVSKTAIDSPSPITMVQPEEEEEETTEAETTPTETVDYAERQTVEKAPEAAMATDRAVADELNRRTADLSLTSEKSGRTVRLGLYMMDGVSDQMSSNGVLMAEEMAKHYQNIYENSDASAARSSEPIYLTGYEERQYHDRPISYGLTLGYPLTEQLSLTTGVVYTKLVSTFVQEMRKTRIWREQTLHYVGIPVNLNYQLWAQKGFRAYASAGALLYWNVKTHVETEGVTQKMEKDRAQLSLNGSFGLQYDVIPQIGLYVEPGLSYYPDNRSHIQNFFKDKPVNLSLQVGLRVNIK